MTIKELKELIKDAPDDAKVFVENYYDGENVMLVSSVGFDDAKIETYDNDDEGITYGKTATNEIYFDKFCSDQIESVKIRFT